MTLSPALLSPLIPLWYPSVVIWIIGETVLIVRNKGISCHCSVRIRIVLIFYAIFCILLALLAALNPLFQFSADPTRITIVSLFLIWVGMAIRFSAASELGVFYSPKMIADHGHHLIRTGLYRYIRHPSGLGFMVVVCGVSLICVNYLVPILVLGGLAPVILVRIFVEEDTLHNRFGYEYHQYCERTCRLIPGLF
ncbi:MAG: isoprenylcysteine carboxylmethyltransferase family protein [Methanospirillum sp.]|uniref:methyltransferase family protein n=1 Tax=Methanospirillum sp. TaxID=45200 RepID=UPI00237348A8|nr:isoprenylcysteine carboxylmethyltransferase family protein [Methanospirillum sp.]MDD1728056.1 isoprenylcysteine carboxylmethyltransferase family protein [Methanospirillum sp.]